MWKDSWEIIIVQPKPGPNKGPAVKQEVTSGAALRHQQSSLLREESQNWHWYNKVYGLKKKGRKKISLSAQIVCVNLKAVERDMGSI